MIIPYIYFHPITGNFLNIKYIGKKKYRNIFFRFRKYCCWLVKQNWFDNIVLLFIALNCITLAMERPNIPPDSTEKLFLQSCNYIFSVVFATEMFVKVNSKYKFTHFN